MRSIYSYLKEQKGFFGLIGVVLAIAITLFLCYLALNSYFKPRGIDRSTQRSLSRHGIDTSTSISAFDSTKIKIKDIKKELKRRDIKIDQLKDIQKELKRRDIQIDRTR